MRFILKTACLSFLCLFFTVNIYAQTTKKTLQTIYPDKTIRTVKILSNTDSNIVNTWSGDFILIHVEVKTKGINLDSVNDYKAEYEQHRNTVIINLNQDLPAVFADGAKTPIVVEYEIFIPEGIQYDVK